MKQSGLQIISMLHVQAQIASLRFAMTEIVRSCQGNIRSSRCPLIVFTCFVANKPMLLVLKQYIKSSERSINTRNILLQVYFVFIA